MTTIQIDNVVLVAMERLNRKGKPYGIRALVRLTGLADKTISKAIKRLEETGRLRVKRGMPGTRHEYVILVPPNEVEIVAASIYIYQKENIDEHILANGC